MVPRCSRNARSQKTLVGRAQWGTIQPPPFGRYKQAWKESGETAGMVSLLAEPPR